MERPKYYIVSDLPVAGVAITFESREDAIKARHFLPPGLTIRSLGRGFVANAEILRALAEAQISVYRFVEPGRKLGKSLDIEEIVAKLEHRFYKEEKKEGGEIDE